MTSPKNLVGGLPFGSDPSQEYFGEGTISLSWGIRGTVGQGYFPQNRQFFFARAFGAREILAIRWWGERTKNEPFVRKRSWRILSV